MLSSIDWISSQLDEFLSKLNDLSRDFGVVFHRDSLVDLFRDEAGVELPPKGHYATGICFVDEASRAQSEAMFQDIATECSLQVLDDSSRKNRKCDYTELGKAICCPIRSREALKNEQYISFSQHRKEGKIDTPIMSGNIATRRARLTVKTFEIWANNVSVHPIKKRPEILQESSLLRTTLFLWKKQTKQINQMRSYRALATGLGGFKCEKKKLMAALTLDDHAGHLLADGAGEARRHRRGGAPVRAADAPGLRHLGQHDLHLARGRADFPRKGTSSTLSPRCVVRSVIIRRRVPVSVSIFWLEMHRRNVAWLTFDWSQTNPEPQSLWIE